MDAREFRETVQRRTFMICEEHMQHGRPWRGENVADWFAVEKMDGGRGYWDGERMWSRSGRVIPIPETWRAKLPAMHLDGEIFAGRGMWETTVKAVVRGVWDPRVCYIVFDAPQIEAPWPKRLAAAKKKVRCGFADVAPYQKVRDIEHAAQIFRTIRLAGGEGLMLVHPTRAYSSTRAGNVLKLKKCPLTGELAWSERRFNREAA